MSPLIFTFYVDIFSEIKCNNFKVHLSSNDPEDYKIALGTEIQYKLLK